MISKQFGMNKKTKPLGEYIVNYATNFTKIMPSHMF
jgi:hypothetical protein